MSEQTKEIGDWLTDCITNHPDNVVIRTFRLFGHRLEVTLRSYVHEMPINCFLQTLEIDDVFVHEPHRDKGYGSLLLADLIGRATIAGYRDLVVQTTNKQVRGFLRKNGFVVDKSGLRLSLRLGTDESRLADHNVLSNHLRKSA